METIFKLKNPIEMDGVIYNKLWMTELKITSESPSSIVTATARLIPLSDDGRTLYHPVETIVINDIYRVANEDFDTGMATAINQVLSSLVAFREKYPSGRNY